MRDIIKQRVRVGENEAFEQFSREKATATLDFVRLERRFYADLVLDTSPKAMEAWAGRTRKSSTRSGSRASRSSCRSAASPATCS